VSQTQSAGNRILIVDDEPMLLKMLQAYLRRVGFEIVAVSSAGKAWAEFEAAPHSFAVTVLDATLKGIAMEDLASRMLASDSRLCVIVSSGYPVDVAALQASAPGRVIFLPKPFTAEMLGKAVRRMLATQEKDL
jgi:two-component system, cell cycle sensor histidine kinase and response regulator CckA